MKSENNSRAVATGAGLLSFCFMLPAVAQDTSLEEITVTAQRREQSELDVPMTLDVFSAKDIEETGALNLMEMQDFIPGFEMGSNPTQSSITVRGISSANISTGGDPSVATFYDDIYVPRAATTASFTDLQRVEVLKGPQGTLYGRNAAVGVVSMVPNRPGAEDEAFVKARVGNYNLMRLEAMGNIAISDNFFLRANILSNQRDGYLTNNAPGERDPGEQDNITARISALWEISDATDLQVSYDYDKVDNSARGAVGLSSWAACPTDPRCGDVLNDVVNGKETRDMWAANAKLTHQFSDQWFAKFVTGYRTFDTINKQDEDGTAEFDRYLDTDNVEESDIFYSELQFNFENERVNVVFGANYSKEDTYQEIPVNTNTDSVMRAVTSGVAEQTGFPLDHLWNPAEMAALMSFVLQEPVDPDTVVATGDLFYEMVAASGLVAPYPFFGPSHAGLPWSEYYYNNGDFTNWGIYGDADFQVNNRWNLLFGLRYSNDEKTFSWRNPPNTFNAVRPDTPDLIFLPNPDYPDARSGTLSASNDWDKWTGRAVARYQLTDSASMFASYSTGYIAGGYDSLNVGTSDNPLRPEETENLELGLKGDFIDGRVRAQLSLFDMTVEGRKTTVDTRPPGQPNPIPTVITGDQDVQGIELVLNWMITDTVRLGFLTTTRDSEVTWQEFYDSDGELAGGSAGESSTNTDYTLTFGWQPNTARGDLDMRIDYIFNEDTSSLNPDYVDPAEYPDFYEDRKELNARIAWTSETDQWTAALWGKNLLDQKLLGGIGDISAPLGTPFTTISAPLTWGVEVGYRF